MKENTRIPNPKLREYMKQLAIDSLESSNEFVKVFGKGFVKRKFEQFVRDIYSNEKNEEHDGYYEPEKGAITLCSSGKAGELLTQEDIEQNPTIQATSVHETVHAILTKSKKECKAMGVKNATGLHETNNNGGELGRGKNEGYTEWVCKKAGLKATGYPILTSKIEQLEIALGPTKVMKMGKGNIKRRIPKILGMPKRGCKFFLGLLDQEYSLERSHSFFQRTLDKLKEKIEPEALEKIKNDGRISGFLKSEEYRQELLSGKTPEEVISSFAKEQLEDIAYNRRVNLLLIDSTVFDKYFKSEFEQIQSDGIVTEGQMKRFAKLSSLMCKDTNNEEEKSYSSIKFQKKFEEIRKRYLENIYKSAIEELNNGVLSSSRLTKYFDAVKGMDIDSGRDLMERIAGAISPQYINQITMLLSHLEEEGKLQEIYRYSMQQIKTEESEETVVYKDGILEGELYHLSAKRSGKEENVDSLSSFTLDEDEESQNVINNFLELRQRIIAKDPKARINIASRAIIVEGVEGRQDYIIENGEIKPAKAVNQVTIPLAEEPKRANLPAVLAKGPIGRIRNKLLETRVSINEKREQKRQDNQFKKRISDLSNYTPCPVGRSRIGDTKAKENAVDGHESEGTR